MNGRKRHDEKNLFLFFLMAANKTSSIPNATNGIHRWRTQRLSSTNSVSAPEAVTQLSHILKIPSGFSIRGL